MVETAAKIMFFVVFTALLYFAIDFVMDIFKSKLKGVGMMNNINYFMCWLGIYDGLNILLSMIIGNWFVTKIIKYASY